MLFNSLAFLLLFLPAVALLTLAVERVAPAWRVGWLVLVSLVFYGSFDIRFVPLLAASIALNWLVALLFARSGRGYLVAFAIAANLALLGLYKYLDFAVGILDALPGVSLDGARLGLSARHLLLHLPAHQLSGGPEGRKDRARLAAALCALRRLLPARDRGAAGAAEGVLPAARGRPAGRPDRDGRRRGCCCSSPGSPRRSSSAISSPTSSIRPMRASRRGGCRP